MLAHAFLSGPHDRHRSHDLLAGVRRSTYNRDMSHSPRIKVCCIASPDEARMAIDAGVDAIGLVSAMPSGPGPIPLKLIAEIARGVPTSVDTFLLTSETSGARVVEQLEATGCNTVQLVDAMAEETDAYATIRAAHPSVRVVQVIHVEDELALDEAFRVGPHVDALLLDSGRPKASTKELGGTGRAHDWTLSRRIVGAEQFAHVPVWLAGGLTPENVGEAIRTAMPHGVDVCSGLRTDGRLDEKKLHAFVAAVRGA